MTAEDFRELALELEGAVEGAHMGHPDFRVGGHIFATLAAVDNGLGTLMLTVEQQGAFLEEMPEVFFPCVGGWGRKGATHIRLKTAHRDLVAGALRTAWMLRVNKNLKPARKKKPA